MSIKTANIALPSSIAAIASATIFIFLLGVLYFLEPEFNPPHMISEYELGSFGWLMSVAFFCMGLASFSLLYALWPDLRSKGGRFGRWGLLLIGIAYLGAGVFIPDPTSIVESRFHGFSGIVIIFGSPIVCTLLWRNLIQHPHWARVSRPLKWTTLLTWLGLLLFYGSIIIFYGLMHGSGTVVVGWTNRFMIATYCAWIVVAAWQAIKMGRSEGSAEE